MGYLRNKRQYSIVPFHAVAIACFKLADSPKMFSLHRSHNNILHNMTMKLLFSKKWIFLGVINTVSFPAKPHVFSTTTCSPCLMIAYLATAESYGFGWKINFITAPHTYYYCSILIDT